MRYTNLMIDDTKALSPQSCSPNDMRLTATWQPAHITINRLHPRNRSIAFTAADWPAQGNTQGKAPSRLSSSKGRSEN